MKGSFGLANALTAVRLVLVMPSCWSLVTQRYDLAALIFCVAVATDLADGRVARARGEVSALGGLFDHSVDATFVALSLFAISYASLNGADVAQLSVTPLLPLFVGLSFAQYALDSKVLAGQSLRASALGRYNGIGYFVLLGIAAIGSAVHLPEGMLHPLVYWFGWLLFATTLLSMLDRLLAFRKVRGSP